MPSPEIAQGLKKQSGSDTDTQEKDQPGICSADIFDFKSGQATLLARAEILMPTGMATDTAVKVAELQEQKPTFSKEMEKLIDSMSTQISEKLDERLLAGPQAFAQRQKDVGILLTNARTEIIRQDRNNARDIYIELLKKIEKKDTKFKGTDLALKFGANNLPEDMLIIPAYMNRQAMSVAEKFDNNQQDVAALEFWKIHGGLSEADKITFSRAVNAYEKDLPYKDVQIEWDANHQLAGLEIDSRKKASPEELARIAAEAAREGKKLPEIGIAIPFDKLLTEYKTSFGDAYRRSKDAAAKYKDIDEARKHGYSSTLEEAVERLQTGMPLHHFQIVFAPVDYASFNPDGTNLKLGSRELTFGPNTIILDSRDAPVKQIEKFGHESFHATHQNNKRLFLNGKLPKEEYLKLKGYGEELESHIAAIKIHQEVTSKMDSAGVFMGYTNRNGEDTTANLSDLYAKEGKAGLSKLVIDEARNVDNIRGEQKLVTYREQFLNSYDTYISNARFNRLAEKYRALYKSGDPVIRKLLDDGF
jgi:hypothetical protein